MGSPATRAKRAGKPSANAGQVKPADAIPQVLVYREIPQHMPEPEQMMQPVSQCGSTSTADGSQGLVDEFRSVSQGDDGSNGMVGTTADGSIPALNSHPNVTQAFLQATADGSIRHVPSEAQPTADGSIQYQEVTRVPTADGSRVAGQAPGIKVATPARTLAKIMMGPYNDDEIVSSTGHRNSSPTPSIFLNNQRAAHIGRPPVIPTPETGGESSHSFHSQLSQAELSAHGYQPQGTHFRPNTGTVSTRPISRTEFVDARARLQAHGLPAQAGTATGASPNFGMSPLGCEDTRTLNAPVQTGLVNEAGAHARIHLNVSAPADPPRMGQSIIPAKTESEMQSIETIRLLTARLDSMAAHLDEVEVGIKQKSERESQREAFSMGSKPPPFKSNDEFDNRASILPNHVYPLGPSLMAK